MGDLSPLCPHEGDDGYQDCDRPRDQSNVEQGCRYLAHAGLVRVKGDVAGLTAVQGKGDN